MKNSTLKCIILDDEMPSLKFLKLLIDQMEDVSIVKAFNNPMLLIEEYKSLDFDFCILDIEMPQLTGLELAEILREYPIVFATAYKQYASDAFDIDAVDYVTKPISLQRLKQAIDKVRFQLSNKVSENTFWQFNTDRGKAIVYFDQIHYIRNSDIDSRDKIVFLEDGSAITVKNVSFYNLLGILPAIGFVRINKRELVSIKIIKFFNAEEIITTLKDQHDKPLVLGLSDTYRKAFMDLVAAK